jgi:hypothetical protein
LLLRRRGTGVAEQAPLREVDHIGCIIRRWVSCRWHVVGSIVSDSGSHPVSLDRQFQRVIVGVQRHPSVLAAPPREAWILLWLEDITLLGIDFGHHTPVLRHTGNSIAATKPPAVNLRELMALPRAATGD